MKYLRLKKLVILPLITLIFSTINVIPASAALGDGLGENWEATASGSEEMTRRWTSTVISSDGTFQVAINDDRSIYTSSDSGNTWVKKYDASSISGLGISGNGSTIVTFRGGVAGPGNGSPLLISKDYGQTWADTAVISTARCSGYNTVEFSDFSVSVDGSKIFAITGDGRFFGSTNSGESWNQLAYPYAYTIGINANCTTGNNANWKSIEITADGTKLIAIESLGQTYVSTDSGATWIRKDITLQGNWRAVASSSDGTKLVAVDFGSGEGGKIWVSRNSGSTWTAKESNRNWRSVASSSDGTKLVAVVEGGQIYVSTNSGDTWSAKATNKNWTSVASSTDGSNLVAGDYAGNVFESTDSGETWVRNPSLFLLEWTAAASSADGEVKIVSGNGEIYIASTNFSVDPSPRHRVYSKFENHPGIVGDWGPSGNWSSLAISADGTKLFALDAGGQIWVSVNSGVNWTAKESNRDWQSVASSSDGTKIVAVANGGQIYVSSDSGETWSAKDSNRAWKAVTSSSDGTKLVAAVDGGQIYVSNDSGETWNSGSSNTTWMDPNTDIRVHAVAVSADGTKLYAADYGGFIYVSNDSGETWVPKVGEGAWRSIATSSDGTKFFGVIDGGQIWISNDSGESADYYENNRAWKSVAASAGGTKLIAVEYGGRVYVSNDSGLTWNAKSTGLVPLQFYWYDIESSSSGQYLYANRDGDSLLKSSDYGATWSEIDLEGFQAYNNSSIAVSADGAKVAVLIPSDFDSCEDGNLLLCHARVFNSVDYGQTWTSEAAEGISNLNSIAISADAQIQVVTTSYLEGSLIFISRDYGQTWAEEDYVLFEESNPVNVSVSANGQKIVVSTDESKFFISEDSGQNWDIYTLDEEGPGDFTNEAGTNIAISADGSKLYAITSNGVYLSEDLGSTWSETSITPQPDDGSYVDIKLNQDGSGILLADYDGKVLFSENSGQSWNTIFNEESDYYLLSITAAQDFSTVAFSAESNIYVSHSASFVIPSTPSANNDNGGASTPTPTPIAKPKIEEVKEKIKEAKQEEKEVIKPGNIAAAEPLIMRLIEDLPVILKPQIVNIFTETPVANQILDSNKVLNILKDIVDKILVDLPSLVKIDGQIQASRLVVVDNTTMQLVTADGGVLSVQANDGENPIPVDQSGKVQMVRSNGVETKGVGLSPNSEFSVYLFSDPTLLGIGKSDAKGNFYASFMVDKDFPLGNHTLQINGVLANGKITSISMPVSVVESVEMATTQAMTKAVSEVKPTTSNTYIVFLLIMLALIGTVIVFKGPRFIYDQFRQRIE